MKIGIVGTGNMGRSIGVVLGRLGHEVLFGARSLDKAAFAASLAPGAASGTNDEAAAFGDVVVYTPRQVAVADILSEPGALRGKIVVDCGNQPTPEPDTLPPITVSHAEELAAQLPGARVIKAFNTLPQEVFELCPDEVRPYQVAVFVAGDDETARRTVLDLATAMGFRGIDCGPLYQSRLLENAGHLIRLMLRTEGSGTNLAVVTTPLAETPTLGGRQASALK